MSSCGSRSHPWHLESPAGQRIIIKLYDFTGSTNVPRARDVTCHQYGYVAEKPNKRNMSICATTEEGGVTPQRESTVYTSDSSSVDVVLVAGTNKDNHSFLIQVHGTIIRFYVHRPSKRLVMSHTDRALFRSNDAYFESLQVCIFDLDFF